MPAKHEVLRPVGGVDEKKFALVVYALALLRGDLYDATIDMNDPEYRRLLQGTTSLASLAAACGYTEAELAISWSDFLSNDEKDTVRCGAS